MSRIPFSSSDQDIGKRAAGEAAVQYVQEGNLIGLGTGSTVKYFLQALGERIQNGFHIQGIPTSKETAQLASQLGIPLLDPESEWVLDLAVDGADQVDSSLNLIKGGGGALLREKIVASAAKKFLVIIDEAKQVPQLGKPWAIPIEVIPFGWPNTARLIHKLGGTTTLRKKNGQVFLTDNGHYILDFHADRIENPGLLESQLNAIPGVVENGLFVGRTSLLLVGSLSGVEVIEPPQPLSQSP